MELRQMKYFVTVMEEGTISAAAKKLYMSQPPLSVQISKLEKELGCVLFERTRERIEPTETGKMLYKRAKLLLNMAQVTEEEVAAAGKKFQNIIRIGMISSSVDTRISSRIFEYLNENPELTVDIREGNTYDTIEALRNQMIHFAIVRTPFPECKFKQILLSRGSIAAVGTEKFLPVKNGTISLEDLSKKPLIIYRRWEKIIRDTFEDNLLSPHFICINDDMRTSIYYALLGAGVALVPLSSRNIKFHGLNVSRIEGKPWKSDLCIIYDSSCAIPGYARKMLDYISSGSPAG